MQYLLWIDKSDLLAVIERQMPAFPKWGAGHNFWPRLPPFVTCLNGWECPPGERICTRTHNPLHSLRPGTRASGVHSWEGNAGREWLWWGTQYNHRGDDGRARAPPLSGLCSKSNLKHSFSASSWKDPETWVSLEIPSFPNQNFLSNLGNSCPREALVHGGWSWFK